MTQCRCGSEIYWVRRGDGSSHPFNVDLTPHVCGSPGPSSPVTTAPVPRPEPGLYPRETKDRRISAMWALGQAITLTAGTPTDLDTRIALVKHTAETLYVLVDQIAGTGARETPASPATEVPA